MREFVGIRIEITAQHGIDDEKTGYKCSYKDYGLFCDISTLQERLRLVGLEYKTADYFPGRAVTISLTPEYEEREDWEED